MARRSPVIDTILAFVAVAALQPVLWLVADPGLLALSADVGARPWALVTTVYAHAGPGHLLANAVALAVVGPLVSRRTSILRFHAFFLGTGALAALAEVAAGTALGGTPVVVGASGAILGLAGYLLAGNVVTAGILDRIALSPRVKVALFVVVVAGVTLLASGDGRVALVAHATGLAIGLVAGRLRVLDVDERTQSQPVAHVERD